MTARLRSLRVQLAVVGFVAIYVPVLLVFGVTVLAEDETSETDTGGPRATTETETSERPPWAAWTVVLLAPTAAAVSWWWSGRAVRPIERVRTVAEDIGASDLGRRISLDHGPTEVVALADAFDAMLERLEGAADTQRRLVEETSHELRTPLAVLVTNAEVVLSQPDPTEADYRRAIERSVAAADRLRSTVDDLLVDARGRARVIDRQPSELVDLVRGIVDEARVLAAHAEVGVGLAAPASVPIAVDEPTVRRALSNLVGNAVRHAPPGSTVDVEIRLDRGHVAVIVTDQGPGVAGDQQERIFERFVDGGTRASGSGLGLSIARHVAIAHGGDVTVRSPGASGRGAQFTLTLRRPAAPRRT